MITKKEIKKLSFLARISVSEKETEELQKDLKNILNFVSKLKKADVSGIKELKIENKNVLRKDNPPDSGHGRGEALLKLAPEIKDGYLKVKKVL